MRRNNFLELYLELNRGTEVPPLFAQWCGLAAASCALGRRVFTQFGMNQIYPNFYIILVAQSALQRKSTAISVARKLVEELQPKPKILAQKITPQALIQAIRNIEVDDPTRFMRETGTGYVMADELNVFLNKQSYEAGLASLLIKMFDCDPYVDYQTVGRGIEAVHDSCLGILAGSTIEWLKNGVTEDAVGGGLTSRMIFVYCDQKAGLVPWPVYDAKKVELRDKCRLALQEISTYQGEVTYEPEARQLIEQHYIEFNTVRGLPLLNSKNLAGYAGRRQLHQIKICSVFAAVESREMIVTRRHVEAADMILSDMEQRLPMVMSLITSTQVGNEIAAIRNFIISHPGGVTRTAIQKTFSNRLRARELSEMLDTLIQSGDITISQVGPTGIMYMFNRT